MLEAARLGLVFEVLEPLCQSMEAERVKLVEGGMSEHEEFLSVEVAGTAQIGVVKSAGGRSFVAVPAALRARSAATPL